MEVVVFTDRLRQAKVLAHIAMAEAKLPTMWLGVLGSRRHRAILRNRDTAHGWQAKGRHINQLMPDRNRVARLSGKQVGGRSQHQQPGGKPPRPLSPPRNQFPASLTDGSFDTRRSETVKPSNW